MSFDDSDTTCELTNLPNTVHGSDPDMNPSNESVLDEPMLAEPVSTDLVPVCAKDNLKLEGLQQELAAVSVASDSATSKSISMEILDPKGDLKLKIKDVVFLVSSNVLILSSSFFRAMLQLNTFSEGVEQPQVTNPPTKVLSEKDPESFFLMLKLLHFKKSLPPVDIDHFEKFADVCDYYDTVHALSAQAQVWMLSYQDTVHYWDDNLGQLLWITYVFDLEDAFSVFAVALAADSRSEQWGLLKLKSMPDALESDIFRLRERMHCYVRDEIESAINGLRTKKQNFHMIGYVICNDCSGQKPLETKRCGKCGCREFSKDPCEQLTRVEQLFKLLEGHFLWPTTPREKRSINELRTETLWPMHSCTGEGRCPFNIASEKIKQGIYAARKEVKGLRLRDYRVSGFD